MEGGRTVTKTYAVAVPLLSLWLLGWIAFSWAAVQDDAFIHLRYAENLAEHHFITYDGVHPNYGASSLLYVSVLAGLRGMTSSADLPRAASTAMHLLIFAVLALGFAVGLPAGARLARGAALVLLALVCVPSAVRWLDDGMETGAAVLLVTVLAWLIHGQSAGPMTGDDAISPGRYLGLALLGFCAVLLRTELVLLCGFGFLILALRRGGGAGGRLSGWLLGRRSVLRGSHLLAGGGAAICMIVSTMHFLLPDTAVAKSHGLAHWFNPIHDTAWTLGGAFSFGFGLFVFWLLTLLLVRVHLGRLELSTVLANAFFPVVLVLATLRGQEIQGVRYFAWTLFFPLTWNILELGRTPDSGASVRWTHRRKAWLLGAFLVVLAVETPIEARMMYRVLTGRSATVRSFESAHLDVLKARRGIASDIGYIGYFTGADICDLAGLVNGRAAALTSSLERARSCMRTDPDFLFVDASQLVPLMGMADLSQWKVCGSYEFTNVTSVDMHYLVVRPGLVAEACSATARLPESIESVGPLNGPLPGPAIASRSGSSSGSVTGSVTGSMTGPSGPSTLDVHDAWPPGP